MSIERIQTPTYANRLRRAFGLIGSVGTEIDTTISSVAIVDDLSGSGPLAPVRRCAGGGAEAAVAAQFAGSSLTVPPGTLAHVLEFRAGGLVQNREIILGFDAGAGLVGIGAQRDFMDTRLLTGLGNVPSTEISIGSQAGALASHSMRISAAGNFGVQNPNVSWVAYSPPGSTPISINAQSTVLNQACWFYWVWDEYSIEKAVRE